MGYPEGVESGNYPGVDSGNHQNLPGYTCSLKGGVNTLVAYTCYPPVSEKVLRHNLIITLRKNEFALHKLKIVS